MKETKRRRFWNATNAIVATVSLIVAIGLLVFTYNYSVNTLKKEHTTHLMNIARSTDKNVEQFLERCQDELSRSMYELQDVDRDYLLTGSTTAIEKRMREIEQSGTGISSMMILLKDKIALYCTHCGRDCEYKFPYGIRYDQPCLCKSDEGNYYLAVLATSQVSGLSYAELVDLKSFYSAVIDDDLQGEYWLVLFNRDMKFYLQNNEQQPEVIDVDPNTVADRHDGISIQKESEDKQEIIAEIYSYTDKDNVTSENLITVIPAALSDNQIFTVGVAVDIKHFLASVNKQFWITILAALFLIAFAACTAHFVTSSVRKAQELKRQNLELGEDNTSLNEVVKEQSDMLHRQRLEIIGTLSSGFAHEFNNLLTPIMACSVLSLQELDDEKDVELKDNLTEIYEASSKAQSLISRILNLSRKNKESSRTLVSPDSILEKVIETAGPSIPDQIEVKVDYNCADECLYVDAIEIGQLLLNIVVNALYAMGDNGGILTLRSLRNGDCVKYVVADTGTGIPADILQHIFDPFFTTKDIGEGTGLRLAISKRIAEEYQGSIEVQSEPSQGTTFTISLPVKK